MVGRDAPYPLESDPSGRAHSPAPEDAALRRVATLVAEGVEPAELFATVAREIVQVVDVTEAALLRYEADRSATVVASVNAPDSRSAVGGPTPDCSSVSRSSLEGGVWGLMCAGPSVTDEMPPEVEARVATSPSSWLLGRLDERRGDSHRRENPHLSRAFARTTLHLVTVTGYGTVTA
jgi:hypothetical protein